MTVQSGWPETEWPEPPEDAYLGAVRIEPTSWQRVDVAAVLASGLARPVPTVGARTDGQAVLYRRKVHSLAGETEAGKSWLALMVCQQVLSAGGACVVIDFEDDATSVLGRLLALDVPAAALRDRFGYLAPSEPVTAPGARAELEQLTGDLKPDLAVIDGMTEALALHGLNLKDNTEVAKFGRLLPRPLAQQGPAVLMLDHLTKDREGRGRYAIGAQHKLAGLDGAAFILDNRSPFGIGRHGKSGLFIAKDRPGSLRQTALPSREGLFWFGDLHLAPAEWGVEAWLEPPAETTQQQPFRPTVVMAKIAAALAGKSLSTRAIRGAVSGKNDVKDLALELLVAEGFVTRERGPRNAVIYSLTRPFEEDS